MAYVVRLTPKALTTAQYDEVIPNLAASRAAPPAARLLGSAFVPHAEPHGSAICGSLDNSQPRVRPPPNISVVLARVSGFPKTVATGLRLSLSTQAPLRLPGMLSTAGHCDQSKGAAIIRPPSLILRRTWAAVTPAFSNTWHDIVKSL